MKQSKQKFKIGDLVTGRQMHLLGKYKGIVYNVYDEPLGSTEGTQYWIYDVYWFELGIRSDRLLESQIVHVGEKIEDEV